MALSPAALVTAIAPMPGLNGHCSTQPVHPRRAPLLRAARDPHLVRAHRRGPTERTWARRAALLSVALAAFLAAPSSDSRGSFRVPAALAEPPTPIDATPAAEVTPIEGEVIPPGQEGLLAEMLGLGAPLAGCQFTDGKADGPIVRSTYTCPGGALVIELLHPDKAPATALRTAKFAVVVESGSPPPGFTDELASRIRSRESAFQWKSLRPPTPARLWIPAVILIAAVALAVALWRKFSARRTRES